MNSVINLIPKIVRASFEGDLRTVELSSITLIRKLKKEHPQIADEIAQALSYYGVGAPVTRSVGIEPPPADRDTFMSLARVDEPAIESPHIIFSSEIQQMVDRFIKERDQASKLLSLGVRPPSSLLLYGPPGVGKTYLTQYLSFKLNLPLVVLDLASSISSYLGKTGQNMKKIINYAKDKPSILFLDEFDAVAKKRDDPTDLGELKRIVNVLLKELENWPSHSVVVAATNHPDMLDKAIWRRFDHIIEIPLPASEIREQLWKLYLNSDFIKLDEGFLKVITEVTEGLSPSDICQLSEHILRKVIIDGDEPVKIIIDELKTLRGTNSGKFNQMFARAAKNILGSKVTQAQIGEWLGISPSTVNHHINRKD